uniref:Uncharacterized protein n=1 Tax=Chromera velia CCMP2878 TaxID=1169474 RepID=A0A0G4HV58_9ALVE|eukprot:Cvel_32145.t1-p1 / transcript=Cvel_32145.t1 / gene=Cvel_32145 / organism=Chromera_velia_CCMP2878 / gene_product=Oxygen-evolving enhancer protein 1, chloroplastic, putative / transcript_product=Oxygen-evolving enhancer protein 1, chloroplastic, putative / location=Cvel_scaffold4931:127-2015(-) / protein_length=212 / sequence_SO=supercontig / SO=protein_coding / is_pseudo=false
MRTTAGLILLSAGAEAFTHWGVSRTPRTLRGSQMRMSASEESEDSFSLADAVVPAMAIGLGLMGGFGTGMDAMALTKDDVGALSYKQIKGTGLANRCAEVRETGTLKLQSGKKYEMIDFCLEPKIFRVVEEDKELPTRLTSRQTYTLDALMGPVSVDGGKVTFKETEGIDFAPTTVQIPSGERVPFLFAAKVGGRVGVCNSQRSAFHVIGVE